jgi:hypothetical protein
MEKSKKLSFANLFIKEYELILPFFYNENQKPKNIRGITRHTKKILYEERFKTSQIFGKFNY